MADPARRERIVIIGGCGHVGLPLGVKTALAGFPTTLVDVNAAAVATVASGRFPFMDRGGDEALRAALRAGLEATTDPSRCREAGVFIFVTGTPVDEHLNPKISEVDQVLDEYRPWFGPETLVVMRSTLFPGSMEHLRERLERTGAPVRLSYCPERVAQGAALEEIAALPQIVSAFDDEAFERARGIFGRIAPEVIRLTPLEAEVAKLMANSWRYLEFAIANQFYMIARQNGLDFRRLYEALRHRYPRAAAWRSPGLTAGPCLFKDTMQLASWYHHNFALGHAAMLVNEGLANFLADEAEQAAGGRLAGRTAGILGLAFKADNDDIRESLSFRVKKSLEFKGAITICHDPHVAGHAPLEEVLARAEVLVVCTPHREYRGLRARVPVVDVWGLNRAGGLEIHPGTKDGGKEWAEESS